LESEQTTKPVFHEVNTIEEAKKFILDMVEILEQTRASCNIEIPGDPALTVRMQRKAYTSWMIRYGQALGSLTTLMHCRKLNDVAYNDLRMRIMRTTIPTIVGQV
jgi:hypothetical protein